MHPTTLTRRGFHRFVAGTIASASLARFAPAADDDGFRLRYVVASCMYGKVPLAELLPEVRKTGAEHIEIWAERHGNQREQIDEMGEERFAEVLEEHDVKLGGFTCFKYGIFNMQGEMQLVSRLGGDLCICNTSKPKGLADDGLKAAVIDFAEQLKPHVEFAEEVGVTIGVENHSGGLINTPDSLGWLMDAIPSNSLGIAMAPYHLPQDTQRISRLITDLGERLVHFQAWEHGKGCMQKLPKQLELMQLPHRGPLDWTPLLAALKAINYPGRTEIFMHPVPRGIPILPTIEEVTAEINAGRAYLEACLARI